MPKRTLFLFTVLVILAAVKFTLFPQVPDMQAYQPPAPAKAQRPMRNPLGIAYDNPSDNKYRSAWIETRKNIYRARLADSHPAILVIPFESQGRLIDKIGRSLMTRALVDRLQQGSSRTVADFDLVDRAMGDDRVSYSRADLKSLIDAAQPEIYLRGQVGYMQNGLMDFTLIAYEQDDKALGGYREVRKQTWSGLEFSDARFPYEVFNAELDAIASFALPGLDAVITAGDAAQSMESTLRLPDSPEQLLAATDRTALQSAFELELLGVMYPLANPRERDRLFERALRILDGMPGENDAHAVLKARALHYLGRRPGSLRTLQNHGGPAVASFHDFLNGNLPALQKSVPLIESPALRFLAEMETRAMEILYDDGSINRRPENEPLAAEYPGWRNLIVHDLSGENDWNVDASEWIKLELDRINPVSGLSLESTAMAIATRRGIGDYDVHLAETIANHVVNSLELLAGGEPSGSGVSTADYVYYLDAAAQSNAVREVVRMLSLQGLPERADERVSRYLDFYDGHPYLLMLKANAGVQLLESASGARSAALGNSILDALSHALAMAYETDIYEPVSHKTVRTWLSRASSSSDIDTSRAIALTVRFSRLHGNIFPPRSSRYVYDHLAGDVLDYVNDDIYTLTRAYESVKVRDPEAARALVKSNAHRFVGHYQYEKFLGYVFNEAGDTQATATMYRKAVETRTSSWEPYRELGYLTILDGDYDQALEIFMSYPGFRDASDRNRVRLANQAYDAGSILFWRGAWEQAVTLYELCATYGTGAEAEMASMARLATLKRDFVTAAQEHLSRGKRYNSHYGFRDFLAYLHLLGESDQAWVLFDSLLGSYDLPSIWESALVGHRLNQTPRDELVRWMTDEKRMVTRHDTISFPARFGLMALTMDRAPDDAAPDIIRRLARDYIPVTEAVPADGTLQGPMIRLSDRQITLYRPEYPLPESTVEAGQELDPEYVLFARGYNALKRRDFDVAWRELALAGNLYSMNPARTQDYKFPYIARAAVKSGKAKSIAEALAQARKDGIEDREAWSSFDYHLGAAFLEAQAGRHDAAVQHLEHALIVRPHVQERPVMTAFQFAEACQWLYEDFGDRRYRDIALEWARDHQAIEPMYAWAYAMEAKYTNDPEDRIRALAIAQHMDSESLLIADIPDSEKAQARKWFEKNQPFRVEPPQDEAQEVSL